MPGTEVFPDDSSTPRTRTEWWQGRVTVWLIMVGVVILAGVSNDYEMAVLPRNIAGLIQAVSALVTFSPVVAVLPGFGPRCARRASWLLKRSGLALMSGAAVSGLVFGGILWFTDPAVRFAAVWMLIVGGAGAAGVAILKISQLCTWLRAVVNREKRDA